jgi:hypothetical protein
MALNSAFDTALKDTQKKKTGTGVYASQANAGITKEDEQKIADFGTAYNEAKAKNDKAGMAAAHQGAQDIRKKYYFDGGIDGSEYNKLPTDVGSTLAQGGYTAPLSTDMQVLIDKVKNPQFDWNPETDTFFQKAKAQMLDNANKAYSSSVAGSSIPGIATNSVAEQIANTGRNEYLKGIDALEKTYFDDAYRRYQDSLANNYNALGAIQSIDNTGYNRFADNRNFNQDVKQQNWANDFSMQQFEHNKSQDAFNNDLATKQFGETVRMNDFSIYDRTLDNERQDAATKQKTSGESSTFTTSQIVSQAKDIMSRKDENGNYIYGFDDISRWLANSLPKTPEGDKAFDDIMNMLEMQYPNRNFGQSFIGPVKR